MHEKERHRVILSAVEDRPVVTVIDACNLTGASEATIRRDIANLHIEKKLRRVRGGAEAIAPPQFTGLAGRTFAVNETLRIDDKQAIAQAAAALCDDGDSIIINGGTTTFQMVHPLVFRNEFVMQNGGKIIFTGTNQAGNFKIGPDVTINQLTGTISGRSFSQSLLNTVTPLIIALA